MLTKKFLQINEEYKEQYNLVVGMHYGSEGITPCHNKCSTSCISSSGDSICGGYDGHEAVELLDGTRLYIVMCACKVNCSEGWA